MKHESLVGLLESAVSEALQEIGPKLDFWNIKTPVSGETLWKRPNSLGAKDLPSLLKSIDPEKLNPDQSTLLGIAWEFVWGQPTPEKIHSLKNQLLEKVANQQDLTDLEKLWYGLICIDTDIF